jgi:TP901 family phage tail tape measure protein
MAKPALIAAAAITGIVAVSVKEAADFQASSEKLVTGAGESQKALGSVRQGILTMAAGTSASVSQLTSAMYMIESAGYHGAAGLKVLNAAQQGAAVGGADLGTVANALTTVMTGYGNTIKSPTDAMNMLVETVASGKMQMGDLASSLSNVVPIAAASHISFSDIAGAIATMTGQGVSAQQTTQNLASVIGTLQKPSTVAVSEMNQLGLNAQTVQQNLGKKGLSGTLEELSQAVLSHMGPSGAVLISTLKQSQNAAADMKLSIDAMPPSLQTLAKGLESGSLTMTKMRTAERTLPAAQRVLLQQFSALYTQSHGFNDAIKAGGPAAQTFASAMSDMTGGATGLNVSLMLTGQHAKTMTDNIKNIGKAGDSSGKQVQGFAATQKTLSFQFDSLKSAIQVAGIELGNVFLPIVTTVVKGIGGLVAMIAGFVAQNKWLAPVILVVVGALATFAIAVTAINTVTRVAAATTAAWNAVMDANPAVLIALAVIGLIAAIVLLATHWTQVTSIIKSLASDAWNFINSHFVEPIRSFTSMVVGWFKDAWDTVTTDIRNFANGIGSIFQGVSSVVGGVIRGIVGVAKGIADGIIGSINAVIGIIDKIQVHIHFGPVNMDWSGLNLPKIPVLDTGAIVTGPTLAMLSANNIPEAVTPLSGPHAPGGGRGSTVIELNFNGYTVQELPTLVVNALTQYERKNGSIPITTKRGIR